MGIGIAIVQQITGVNSIMYYGTQILTDAGFSADSALTANIANGVISVLATFVGIYLLGRVEPATDADGRPDRDHDGVAADRRVLPAAARR